VGVRPGGGGGRQTVEKLGLQGRKKKAKKPHTGGCRVVEGKGPSKSFRVSATDPKKLGGGPVRPWGPHITTCWPGNEDKLRSLLKNKTIVMGVTKRKD